MKCLIFSLLILSSLFAREIHYLGRSPKALLMGDAYTTLAKDEYTLFYNPAILGGHKGVSLTSVAPRLSATNALDEMDRFENFPSSDASAITDRVLGLPINLELGAYASLKISRIGMSIFGNSSTNITLRNAIYPQMDIDYNYDRGFIAGYAHNIYGSERGSRTSIGLSVKNINRSSLSSTFDLFGTRLLNIISDDEVDGYRDIRNSLGYSYGKAWGVDLGFEQVVKKGSSTFRFGISSLDLFGTNYRKIRGDYAVSQQEMLVQAGVSVSQKFFLVDYNFSVDIHPLNVDMPSMRKLHVGLDFGLPLVRILLGWNGGYKSYGISLNMWPVKLIAGFYSVEQGRSYKQEEASRAMIYLSLLDFSFDG